MTRKQFIESHGATCVNWTWSWSFINKSKKFIIFGSWSHLDDGEKSLILDEEWKISARGRRSNGYNQSRDHIRLIEEAGYDLFTFSIKSKNPNDDSVHATIERFDEILLPKKLYKNGNKWYAVNIESLLSIPEELPFEEEYYEGISKTIKVNAYERNNKAREACLNYWGYKCNVCGFSFEEVYGEIGKNYIHVHHKIPISEIKREYAIDPINDLMPVCPNCHTMLHSKTPPLTVDELRILMKR